MKKKKKQEVCEVCHNSKDTVVCTKCKKGISKQKVCWGIGNIGGGNLDVMKANEKDFKKLLNRNRYYFCHTCSKLSICTKPTRYEICPCGADLVEIKQ